MANELIPPPVLAPPSVKHLPLDKRIALWRQLVDDCDALYVTGLKRRVGEERDSPAVYREWYARYTEDRERAKIQFLEYLSRREAARGD